MSRIIATAAIRGAHQYMDQARQGLAQAMEAFGPQKRVEFPNTAYYLPLILALTGLEVKTLADVHKALEHAESLLPPVPTNELWLPYLGPALDAGVATLIAEEVIEALKYLGGQEPEPPWLGFTDDATLRTQGIKLVDGRMPGFAACVGALPTNEEAVELARSLQERSILVFMASNTNGRSMAGQLAEEGVEMTWDTFLVPYGKDTSAAVHALNFAVRAAMTFGGIKPGDLEAARKILLYNKERVHAFVLALGADRSDGQLLTDEKYATAAGAINFGFPVISDVKIPQILPRGICTYEHVVSSVPRDQIVNKAVEVRGLKLKISEIPIPVPYGAGFEGERVRKEQMHVQFGGKYTEAVELLRGRPMDEVEDGKIELIGPDIDEVEEGGALPLGVIAEVAGRNFKEDFETVLERRIHEFSSWAYGVFHMGQRAIVWVRISKDAFAKGFRLRHYGEVIIAKMHEEFGAILDKIQVKIITDPEKIKEPLKTAKEIYRQRDERIMGMRDEDVDTYYSCVLCVPKGEEIVLPDGSFTPVERLIETTVEEKDSAVLTFDTNRLIMRPVAELFVSPSPAKLIKVNLTNGNSSTLTANHKVQVDRDEGLVWVPASQLKEGDYVLTAGQTQLAPPLERKKLYIIDYLPDDYKVSDDGFIDYLKDLIQTKYASKAFAAREFGLPYRRLYGALYEKEGFARYRLTLGEIKRITAALELAWDEIKGRIRTFQSDCRLFKTELDEEVMYIAGLIASDGSVLWRGKGGKSGALVQFTNTEPALIDRFCEIQRSVFGITPKRYTVPPYTSASNGLRIEGKRPTTHCRVHNTLLGRLMEGLGIGERNGEGKWRGEVISALPPKLVAAFLKGLFDGDGHVAGNRALITTGSYREAQHLHLLLKKLGIFSYISPITRGYQVVTRSRADSALFRSLVSSEHPKKRARLESLKLARDKNHVVRADTVPSRCGRLLKDLLERNRGRFYITKLPVDYKTIKAWTERKHRISKEKLTLLLKGLKGSIDVGDPVYQELLSWSRSNVLFERVKSVAEVESRDSKVYNFSVPGTHNYLVNGVVVKNCQSYAPDHVCIVTPERLGLCGAYTWLDCAASYEMNPHGPNQPVKKGEVLEPVKGQWKGVNEYLEVASNGNLERFNAYSMMEDPMTSCGCFECITAILPETNGVMIANREYTEMTPIGMTFSTMAGQIGGGIQTPGFIGMGKLYITSKKFISAEGGIERVVWMPRQLKEEIRERLAKRLGEIGNADLIDKIATEEDATTSEELLAFLQEVGHPVLEMEPMI